MELDPSEFSGGIETNSFLKALGFKIVEKPSSGRTVRNLAKKRQARLCLAEHDERCPKCKETVRKLLSKIFGEVKPGFKLDAGVYPEDFKDTAFYEKLVEIYEALQNYRGFKDFVKARTLPSCDFYIPDPGFIIEFDESQHFTTPRKIALEHYPEFELGFDRERWLTLCERINAKDNDPPYRDEQRAWYDTLRDFIPAVKGLKPTVRLFSQDFQWCSLDPEKPLDVEKFRSIIERKGPGWRIEFREDPDPFIARIIIAGEWKGNVETVKKLLNAVCEKWPRDKKVKFIVTCGGFIQFDWPKHVTKADIGDNKNPRSEALGSLFEEAKEYVERVLDNGLCEKLRGLTDYITLGVDSYKEKISTSWNYISQPHVELVFLVDLSKNRFAGLGNRILQRGRNAGS